MLTKFVPLVAPHPLPAAAPAAAPISHGPRTRNSNVSGLPSIGYYGNSMISTF
jgi:hypothetical protein